MGEIYLALARETAEKIESALDKPAVHRAQIAPTEEAPARDTDAPASRVLGDPVKPLERRCDTKCGGERRQGSSLGD